MLLARMAEQPNLTMRALALALRGRGYRTVSNNMVWKQLRLDGFIFK